MTLADKVLALCSRGGPRTWEPITDVTLNPERAVESPPEHIGA
jgi:hypothetical protein